MAHILTKPASTVPPSPSEIRLRCDKYGRALEVLGLDFPGYLIIESAMHYLALENSMIQLRIDDENIPIAKVDASTTTAATASTTAGAPSTAATASTTAGAPSTAAPASTTTGAAVLTGWSKLKHIRNIKSVEYKWTPRKHTVKDKTDKQIYYKKIIGNYHTDRNVVTATSIVTYYRNNPYIKEEIQENFTSATGFASRVFQDTNQVHRQIQGPSNVKILFTDGTQKSLADINVAANTPS